MFDRVERSALNGGPLVGTNFWTWGGFGHGDPPQEAQGLNSVFSSDETTLALLCEHAVRLGEELSCPD